MSDAHRTYAWRKASGIRMGIARANGEHCVRCGQPIDYSLNGNARMGPTCDHLDPLQLGGDLVPTPELLAPAHRACNSRHGQLVGESRRRNSGGQYAPESKSDPKSNVVPITSGARSSSSGARSTFQAPGASPRQQPSVVCAGSSDPYSPPRILTPYPSNAVGSLADRWVPWLESPQGPNIRLRKWQKLVLHRALLVDADGRLIYRDIIVSTPRQSGKGWLAYALAAIRCQFASEMGGRQTVLHIANNLAAARRIHSLSWRWAESAGLTVRRAMGVERVIWGDESSWDICSVPAIWGASASIAIGDESWDLPMEVITSALQPTMVEREQAQLWLTSTANEEATPLMPTYRRLAIDGAPRTFIAEWSAPPDADIHDPAVWRAATPHWSNQRGELMAASQHTRGFKYQWLNMWPDAEDHRASWLPGWDALPAAVGDQRFGIGSVEVSSDRSLYGAAVACRREDGTLDVWTGAFSDLQAACDWLAERKPAVVLAGLSVKDQVLVPAEVQGVGVKETRFATPVLGEVVRNTRLRHDHGAAMDEQVGWARTSQTEYGDVLSAKASDGPIPTAKAVAWSVWAAATSAVAVEQPAIW